MSTTIEDRVILLLRDESGDSPGRDDERSGVVEVLKSTFGVNDDNNRIRKHGFWEGLDRYTGISAQRWRKAYARRQRPTPDMIEALAQLFPCYAFWLATGITDATNGHIAPHTAQAFPERTYVNSHAADQYFRRSLELAETLFDEAHVNAADDKERMYAAERTRPLAHWWDSPLCDAAYRIASSEEYGHLKELWNIREDERKIRIKYIAEPENRPWVTKRSNRSIETTSVSILGADPRTKHQDNWDLFYESENLEKTKFALSVLNVPPAKLTDEQLGMIANMALTVVEKYLAHHGMDSDYVFPFQGGMIRYGDKGLLQEEIERLTALMLRQRVG